MKTPAEVRGFPGPQMRGTWGTRSLWMIQHGAGLAFALAALSLLILSGCGHPQTAVSLPEQQTAPPTAEAPTPAPQAAPPSTQDQAPARIAPTPAPPGGVSAEDLEICQDPQAHPDRGGPGHLVHRALQRPQIRQRPGLQRPRADRRAPHAAHGFADCGDQPQDRPVQRHAHHRSRPLCGGPADRSDHRLGQGHGRLFAPARRRVRVDVYRTPKPIDTGGRWCVQIGAFTSERKANKLKAQLERKYPDANVIEFSGEDSYWVRIRPQGDEPRSRPSGLPATCIPPRARRF
jgi:rare lipoprotein A